MAVEAEDGDGAGEGEGEEVGVGGMRRRKGGAELGKGI